MIQQINVTNNYPNQSISFNANQQNITLNLYLVGYLNEQEPYQTTLNIYAPPAFFADIFLDDIPIITGTSVIDRTPINLYPSSFNGFIVPIALTGDENVTIETMGTNVEFFYTDNLKELLAAYPIRIPFTLIGA